MESDKFNGLIAQMAEGTFNDMIFSIYNFAEDEFYTHSLARLGYDSAKDCLEYMILDRGDFTASELGAFKTYFEDVLQEGRPVIGILLYKSPKGIVPIAVKPKSYGIGEVI